MDVHLDKALITVDQSRPSDLQRHCFRRIASCLPGNCGTPGNIHTLLDEVDVTVRSGRVVGICGPSGSGKTILADLIARRREPTRGGIVYTLDNEKQQSDGRTDTGRTPETSIVLVNRDTPLIAAQTVAETIHFHLRMHLPRVLEEARSTTHDVTDKFLRALHLDRVRDSRIHELSAGERIRTALGVALACMPLCVVLDDVTSLLEPDDLDLVLRLLRSIANEGTSIVMTIADTRDEVMRYVDETIVLAQGVVVYAGVTSSIRDFFTFATSDQLPQAELVRYIVRQLTYVTHNWPTHVATVDVSMDDDGEDEGDDDSGDDKKLVIPRQRRANGAAAAVEMHNVRLVTPSQRHARPIWAIQSIRERYVNFRRGHYARLFPVMSAPGAKSVGMRDVAGPDPVAVHGQDLAPDEVAADEALHAVRAQLKRQRAHVCVQTMLLLKRFVQTTWRWNSNGVEFLVLLCAMAIMMVLAYASTARVDDMDRAQQRGRLLFVSVFVTTMFSHGKVNTAVEDQRVFVSEQGVKTYSTIAYAVAQSLHSMLTVTLLSLPYASAIVWIGAAGSHAGAREWALMFYFLFTHAATHAAIVEAVVMITGAEMRTHIVSMFIAAMSCLNAGFLQPQARQGLASYMFNLSYTGYSFCGMTDVAFERTSFKNTLDFTCARSLAMDAVLAACAVVLARLVLFAAIWHVTKRTHALKKGRLGAR